MIETKGLTQGSDVALMISQALEHSETTATTHYRLTNPEIAIRRQETVQSVDDTANVDEYITQK